MKLAARTCLPVLLLTATLTAQCPLPTSVTPPNLVPVSAGQWSFQHFAQPLIAGQLAYILISPPVAVPVPFAALPWLFCNTVGNTPCLYADFDGLWWLELGPTQGQNATLNVIWPNNPALVGTVFVAQFGTAGCVGPGPDLSVLVTVQLT